MFNLLYSCSILILLLLILCIDIKIERTDQKSDILKRFNSLRGIFAIEIIVGHVIRYENTILYPLGKFMIVSVAFFFFISAFGMVYSFQLKKDYLNGFIVSKCGYLLGIAVVTYLASIVAAWLVPVDIGYWTGIEFVISDFFTETNWYIWELIWFYIMFYVIFRYTHRYRWIYFFIMTMILTTVLFELGWPEKWCASSLAFAFGILYGEHHEKVNGFICSKKGIVVTCFFVLAGLGSLLLGMDSLIGVVYLRNIMCIAVLLILINILGVFKPGNCVLHVLVKYSTELYLFQFIYLRISVGYGWDFKVRMPFVIVMTGMTALVMNPFLTKIKEYLKKVSFGNKKLQMKK